MGKHDKRRRGDHSLPVAGISFEAARSRVEDLIAAGQSREAVEVAKQFRKETRGPEAEALVVLAYQARIGALAAKGMYREARELAALVSERFPAHRDRVLSFVRQAPMSFGGNLPALLAELTASEAPRRRELETILTRELTDPQALVDSPALPADDPLKAAARAVRDLFTAVTSGPLTDGALAWLDEIPRRSPLAPWKLLIRALEAFYRRADGVVLANLSAIPAESGPGRLVPILRRLVGEAGGAEDRSLAVTVVLDKVSGGRVRFQQHLRELIQALAVKDRRRAFTAVQDLLALLPASQASVKRVFIATVLDQWRRHGLNPEPLIDALLKSKPDLDTLRPVALALERAGLWEAALAIWDRYLSAAIRLGMLPSSGPEVCRVLLHMGDLFPSDPEAILDVFGVRSEEELRALIRRGEVPECFDRGRLLERARLAHPEPQVFRALVAHYEGREPRRAEAEAEAWRRAHRHDLEPVLYVMRRAERRGAERKALSLLAEAELINRLHPEVRQGRFRLLLASAERRIRASRLASALADLAELDGEPRANEGDHLAYLGALRWAVARKGDDAGGAASLERALASRTGNPVLLDLVLGSVAGAFGLEMTEVALARSQPEAIEGLARAFDLFRAVDRPLTVPPELFGQLEKGVGGASVSELHSLCGCGLSMGRPALAYVASGRGLADDGPHLHRFLLARGQALRAARAERDRERARQCLRAARELAGRARDMEAVHEASTALLTLPLAPRFDPFMMDEPGGHDEAPRQEEIMRTVADERRRRDIPRFAAEAPAPAPRRRRRPRQRELFDEIFEFLEGTP